MSDQAQSRCYLDHAATSPMRPEVASVLAAWFGRPANPASGHQEGQAARLALERAREQVASALGAEPRQVVFTSGATEANHLGLRGLPASLQGPLVLGATEHPCVRAAAEASAREVWILPVDANGRHRFDLLPPRFALLALQSVNHETGVLSDLDRAAAECRRRGARLHVDAVQGLAGVGLDRADQVVLSSHKLGGPPGVGALVVREVDAHRAVQGGGSQERGLRAGTVPTAWVLGFARALELARLEERAAQHRYAAWQQRLDQALRAAGARPAAGSAPRSPRFAAGVFDGLPGEALVTALDLAGIAASAGAACSRGATTTSPVLEAMGDPAPAGGLRFSLGWSTEEREIRAVEERLKGVVDQARALLMDDWEA